MNISSIFGCHNISCHYIWSMLLNQIINIFQNFKLFFSYDWYIIEFSLSKVSIFSTKKELNIFFMYLTLKISCFTRFLLYS